MKKLAVNPQFIGWLAVGGWRNQLTTDLVGVPSAEPGTRNSRYAAQALQRLKRARRFPGEET